jgi:hypothetical protein
MMGAAGEDAMMAGLHQGFSGQMPPRDAGMAGALGGGGGGYRLPRMSGAEAGGGQEQAQQGGLPMDALALPGSGYGWGHMPQAGEELGGEELGSVGQATGAAAARYGPADAGNYQADSGAA